MEPSLAPIFKSAKATRWAFIAATSLAPFALWALGVGSDIFALAAVFCGGVLAVAIVYFMVTDPPAEDDPSHPRHGVLSWQPSTPRHLLRDIAIYGVMIVGSLLALQVGPDEVSGYGLTDQGVAELHGLASLCLVLFVTSAPLELLGALVVRRWGKNPPLNALALWLIGGGVLGWFSGSLAIFLLPPLTIEEATSPLLPSFFFEWGPEIVVAVYVVTIWHRHGRVSAWQARAEAAEKGRQLAEAQLAMLQAQIEPHFLYNTLASVQYLVRKDSAAADFLLTQLIRYLRSAMPKLRSSLSTLGQEFELADAYLQIARMRMGGRLTVSVELSEGLHDLPFPPLVLQTLVENALKHGVEPKVGPVRIVVRAELREDDVAVIVEDNGVGLVVGPAPSPTAGSGTGLSNIRERLQGIYDGRAWLSVNQVADGGVRSMVVVPGTSRSPADGRTHTQPETQEV